MVAKLHECRESIADHSEEQQTYTEAIEEFEEVGHVVSGRVSQLGGLAVVQLGR